MCVRLDSLLECLGNNTSVQQKIIRNFHLEILQSTKVKLVKDLAAMNDFCQVSILKELVDGTHERDQTKATNASVHKKVHESVLKYVLLNYTMSSDARKKT